MCGFAGVYYEDPNRTADVQVLKQMTQVIAHRGPDDDGIMVDQNVGFGFRRLSIIDLAAGHQPMCDSTGRAWILFNGEIYNYQHLRNELLGLGFQFQTKSDTEVILNAYLAYGEGFVSRLRGMFAFAIWDKQEGKIILARDRFGIKPLYYSINKDRLAFGSEMSTLLKGKFSDKVLDWQAVNSYFSYGYILSPLSIFRDIRKLAPGHLLVLSNKAREWSWKITKYWEPAFEEDDTLDRFDYQELIREKLKESVAAHLVSDVPVGAFLSGGIDSNAVVSQMVRLYPNQVKTFSIGFKEAKYNEAVLAKESALKYGTDHTEVYLEPSSVDFIDKIVDIYDEPLADSSAIPTYFVSRLAAQQVKVVLSGDGGDELFGGYNFYQRLLKIKRYKNFLRFGGPMLKLISRSMPETMTGKRFLSTISKDPELYPVYAMNVYEEEKKHFFHPDVLPQVMENKALDIKLRYMQNSNSEDYLSRAMELDIKTYMVDDILTKVDRASMANSLEVRVPLIDHEFFESVARIPSSMLIKNGTGKYIFREAVKDHIPEAIYNKPKTGFTIPLNKWFEGDLKSYINEHLKLAEKKGIINPSYLNQLISKEEVGSLISRVWPIIMFTKWMEKVEQE